MLPRAFKREKGAVMVIVALMMPVLLGFLGMAADYGVLFDIQTKMQNAADAAALAGAGQLPNLTNASNQAEVYADYNYPNIKNINVGFSNSNTEVDVTLNTTFNPYFLGLFGVNSVPIQAKASAAIQSGAAFDYAIFSGSQTDDLDIHGGGWYAKGSIHTNHNLYLTGGGFQVTRNAEASGHVTITGGGYSIGQIIDNSNIVDMPDYSSEVATAAAAAGQVYNGDKTIDGGSININSPMYVKGNVSIKGGNFTGSGAIMADGDITIQGGGVNIGSTSQLCLYSKNGNIDFQGGGGTFNAVIYAPNGTITFHGGGITVNGSIVGDVVNIQGGALNVDSTDYPIKSLPGSVCLIK